MSSRHQHCFSPRLESTKRAAANPLIPLSIFRVRGLVAADITQLVAFAGFYATFFFLTLYMQNILGWSPIKAGAAYLPVTVGLGISATISPKLFARVGTRPVIFAGAMLSAAGIYALSRIPLHGSYLPNVLPGLIVMSLGLGAIFVGATVAANAGVAQDRAGLAAGLLEHLTPTRHRRWSRCVLRVGNDPNEPPTSYPHQRPIAAIGGYSVALQAASLFLVAAGLIALRTVNSHSQPAPPITEPATETL